MIYKYVLVHHCALQFCCRVLFFPSISLTPGEIVLPASTSVAAAAPCQYPNKQGSHVHLCQRMDILVCIHIVHTCHFVDLFVFVTPPYHSSNVIYIPKASRSSVLEDSCCHASSSIGLCSFMPSNMPETPSTLSETSFTSVFSALLSWSALI